MPREQVSSLRQRRNADTISVRQHAIASKRNKGYDGGNQDPVMLAELTTRARKKLKKSKFAIPEKSPGSGSYPIPDRAHAQNALARVSQHGTPAEKARVRKAVKRKYPSMGKAKKGGK